MGNREEEIQSPKNSNIRIIPPLDFDRQTEKSGNSDEFNYKSINIGIKELRSGDLKPKGRVIEIDQVFENITNTENNREKSFIQEKKTIKNWDFICEEYKEARASLTPINTKTYLNSVKNQNVEVNDIRVKEIIERSNEYLKVKRQEKESVEESFKGTIISDRYRRLDSGKKLLKIDSSRKKTKSKEKVKIIKDENIIKENIDLRVKLSPNVITPVKKSNIYPISTRTIQLEEKEKTETSNSKPKSKENNYTLSIKSSYTPVKPTTVLLKDTTKSSKKQNHLKPSLIELDKNSRIFRTRELDENYTIEDLIKHDYKPVIQGYSSHKFNYDSKITPIKHNKVDVSFSTPGTISPIHTDKKYKKKDVIPTSRVRVEANTPNKYSDNVTDGSDFSATPLKNGTREIRFPVPQAIITPKIYNEIRRTSLDIGDQNKRRMTIGDSKYYPMTTRNTIENSSKRKSEKKVMFNLNSNSKENDRRICNRIEINKSKTRVVTPTKGPQLGRYRMSFDIGNTRRLSFKIENKGMNLIEKTAERENENIPLISSRMIKSNIRTPLKSFNPTNRTTPTSNNMSNSVSPYSKNSQISNQYGGNSYSRVISTKENNPIFETLETKKTQDTILFRDSNKLKMIIDLLDHYEQDKNGLILSSNMASILKKFFDFFSNGRITKNDIINFTNKFTKISDRYFLRKDIQEYLIRKIT